MQADIILADLTSKNANVYYELGVAHGVGKQVILTCRKPRRLPFDVASERVIFYEDTELGLRELSRTVATYLAAASEQPGLRSPVQQPVTAITQTVNRLNRAIVEIADTTAYGVEIWVSTSTFLNR